MTKPEVINDLKEIRYFYARNEALREISKELSADDVKDKVYRYNEVMKKAPIRLFDLYVNLYVDNNTQESLAYKWGYTTQTIRNWNNRLCDYLISKLTA